jgi:hypothetical protein
MNENGKVKKMYQISNEKLAAIQDAVWNCCIEHGPITKKKYAAMDAIARIVDPE